MSALHASHPEDHGDRQQPNLPLVLIDRWAQLAVERPWRYAAIWAIGIGAANLGLRMLLNDLSLARNTGMAILTGAGFLVFAWVYTTQLTRRRRRHRLRPATNPAVHKQSSAARWRSGPSGRPSGAGGGPRSERLWSCPRRTEVSASRGGRPPAQSPPGGDAWSSPRLPSSPSPSPYLLVPSRAEVLLPREVTTMCSSQAGGIEGHQWSLHRTSGTRLPCRIVCDCGWTSTAGQRTAVLLQLKGHLEDSLHNGAGLLPAHDQPPAEIPNTPSN
jgi:hypothetical protein